MKNNKGLHDGHRDRLRKRFMENGMESFFDHQAVELMLFYCIPRKDTNDIAHTLLNKFGSFSGLLDASPESLQENGVSSNTAVFIKLISALCSRYYHDKYQKPDDDLCVEDFVISHFTGIKEDQLSLILLDDQSNPIFCDSVSTASVSESDKDIKTILHLSILNNARIAVIVRNRSSGTATPSEYDIDMTVRIRKLLKKTGILLFDYCIISDTEYCSLSNTEEYEDIFFD